MRKRGSSGGSSGGPPGGSGGAADVPAGVPSWARPPSAWQPPGAKAHEANKKEVKAADASGRRLDLALYGDSITAVVRDYAKVPRLRALMLDPFWRGTRFAALGVPGNTVADLAWRLASGAEKPRLDPAVVVFWIGTNDLTRGGAPADRLDWLLGWARSAMPASRLVVLGLLPRTGVDVRPTNSRYAAVAKRRGADFVDCGRGLDPGGRDYVDGLHLQPSGYVPVMRCLAARVKAASPGGPPAPADTPGAGAGAGGYAPADFA